MASPGCWRRAATRTSERPHVEKLSMNSPRIGKSIAISISMGAFWRQLTEMDARVQETFATKPQRKLPHLFILGGGSVTTEYHLPALRLMGRLSNVTVVDPDARSSKERQPSFAGVDLRDQDYVSFLDGLARSVSDPAGVIVALPNQLHVDAAGRALGQGCHVLCEKPLALNAADCAALRTLAAA